MKNVKVPHGSCRCFVLANQLVHEHSLPTICKMRCHEIYPGIPIYMYTNRTCMNVYEYLPISTMR